MTQSDATTITRTGTDSDPKPGDLAAEAKRKRIVAGLVIRTSGAPAAKKPQAVKKPLTPAQRHLKLIAAVLSKMPANASNEEYCEYLDRAVVLPLKGWNVPSYSAAWKKSKKLQSCIRSEKSRARAFKLN